MTFNWLRRSPGSKTPAGSAGASAEKLAEAYLKHQGLRLLERNFNCRRGEIDLIMEDQATLVFVEVRFRQSAHYGSAAETVTAAKQRKLVLAAQHYLASRQTGHSRPLRFDVVGIMPTPQTLSEVECSYEYTWIPNAFSAG